MAKNKTFKITLQLTEVEHLFQKPEISPFSEDYQVYSYISGIEFIANELYADPSPGAVKLNLQLPQGKMTPDLNAKIKSGVARYCLGRLRDVSHDIQATRWRGTRAIALAIIALFVLITASTLVFNEDSFVRQAVSEGLAIAAWVGLWIPLDMLIFKIWEHRLDKKVYNLLSKMEISITPIE